MSFQFIFDNAETISINKNPLISQTITRDQRVRTVARGGAVYRFTVKLPDGFRWENIRSTIAEIEYANKIAIESVNLAHPGLAWAFGYTGELSNTQRNALTVIYNSTQAATNKRQFILGNLPAVSGNITANTVLFKPGDHVQPQGSNYVYTVSSTVLRGSGTTVQLPVHRIILDATSDTAVTLKSGQDVTWRIVCTNLPTWTIDANGLVQWSGNFEFYESL